VPNDGDDDDDDDKWLNDIAFFLWTLSIVQFFNEHYISETNSAAFFGQRKDATWWTPPPPPPPIPDRKIQKPIPIKTTRRQKN